MALIGPPRRKIRCCNDTGLSVAEGRFDVTIDPNVSSILTDSSRLPLMVEIKDFRDYGTSVPTGRVTVVQNQSGWKWRRAHSIGGFNDELSSLGFDFA